MKIDRKVYKFQDGGQMGGGQGDDSNGSNGADQGQQAQQQPQQGNAIDPQQLQQMAMKLIQDLGPDNAVKLAQAIVQIIQSQGQGGQPAYQKVGGTMKKINRNIDLSFFKNK